MSGNNVGVDESITVSGEALSFLSTGIDTRVYYIKIFKGGSNNIMDLILS